LEAGAHLTWMPPVAAIAVVALAAFCIAFAHTVSPLPPAMPLLGGGARRDTSFVARAARRRCCRRWQP